MIPGWRSFFGCPLDSAPALAPGWLQRRNAAPMSPSPSPSKGLAGRTGPRTERRGGEKACMASNSSPLHPPRTERLVGGLVAIHIAAVVRAEVKEQGHGCGKDGQSREGGKADRVEARARMAEGINARGRIRARGRKCASVRLKGHQPRTACPVCSAIYKHCYSWSLPANVR